MTTRPESEFEDVLDQESLELLGAEQTGVSIAADNHARMRANLMSRIDAEKTISAFTTIRDGDGPWIDVGPLMEKKVLNFDEGTGIESYLLRLQPGAEPAGHEHDTDELCVVLEGDVSFDDIHLQSGDYHFARAGTWHGQASTRNGALIFLQAGAAAVAGSI